MLSGARALVKGDLHLTFVLTNVLKTNWRVTSLPPQLPETLIFRIIFSNCQNPHPGKEQNQGTNLSKQPQTKSSETVTPHVCGTDNAKSVWKWLGSLALYLCTPHFLGVYFD